MVLVATGRRPYTTGLGLETMGINMTRGMIDVDEHFQTNVPGACAVS